jgi:branched-chain amino acid transport system permease protein
MAAPHCRRPAAAFVLDPGILFASVLNGLTTGAVYALIALGYTMVYGVLRFINFAHGDVFMIGAFAGLYFHRWLAPVLNYDPFVLVEA